MNKYWHYLAYFLLALGLTLSVFLNQAEASRARVLTSDVVAGAINTEAQQRNIARVLNHKGHEQLNQGQAAAALQTWQEASKIYRQLQYQEGVGGSLINQSLALQALGLYPRACHTLLEALELQEWVCQPRSLNQTPEEDLKKALAEVSEKKLNSALVGMGLQSLGDVLRLLAKPEESELVLKQALAIAERLVPASNTNAIELSLANTERTLYSQARNKYQTIAEPVAKQTALKTAFAKARKAFALYQHLADASGNQQNNTALQAQLNCLSLFLELDQRLGSEVEWETLGVLRTLHQTVEPQMPSLVKQLLTAEFSQFPVIESVYAQLNLVNSLIQISQNVELERSLFSKERKPLLVALQFAQAALQVAQSLNNERAESYALGTIGNVYTYLEQADQSRQYLEKALAKAQSVQSWDIAYQWQQKLGQLYKLLGKPDKAVKAYAAAVDSLDQIRGNILSINPELQFSFKEKVEPVYQEYMRLLLAARHPNFEQVIQTNERLQLAELT